MEELVGISSQQSTGDMRCVCSEKLINLTLLQDQFFPSARFYEERQEDEEGQAAASAEDRASRQLL